MYQSPRVERVADNIIRVYHPDLIEPKTYLTAAVAAAGTTLTVPNNEGFANHDPVILEGFGVENAEIKEIDAAVSAGTSLTVTAVTFAHGVNCSVQKILFDQIEVSGAATLTGTKSGAVNITINAGGTYTDYVLSSALQALSYIFVRYYNSMASTPFYGAFSDGLAADFTPKTVGFIRRNAFANIGEKFDNARWTDQWVYDQIYLGELDVAKELKRWSWLYSYDYDLGNITEGMRRIAVPSDTEDLMTNKSIMGVRIERDINLDPIDWTEYQQEMNGVAWTTVATAASVGDTKLVLTDSRDFDDAGTVTVKPLLSGVVFSLSGTDNVLGTYTTHGLATGDKITVSGCTNDYCNTNWVVTYVTANTFTLDGASWTSFTGADVTGDVVPVESDSIAYTGNSRGTNTLTGITALTRSVAAAVDVWQDIDFGTPNKYAVNNGYIYFDIPPNYEFEGRNIWIDYYKTITKKNSDGDEISVNDPQVLISWLECAIKKEKANGELSMNDFSVQEYNRRKNALIRNEITGQRLKMVPNIPVTNKPISWWR